MIFNIIVAVTDKKIEESLIKKLIGISICMDHEFDISVETDCGKIVRALNSKRADMVFIDFDLAEKYYSTLVQEFFQSGSCVPFIIGEPFERLRLCLLLRPAGYAESPSSIDPEDEDDAVRRVVECLEKMIANGLESKTENTIIRIVTRKGSYAVEKRSILYCQSDLKYTMLVLDNGTIIRKLIKLDQVQDSLLWDFLRIHQSFLVNPDRISGSDSSTNELILDNGYRIPYSKKYAGSVRELFKN